MPRSVIVAVFLSCYLTWRPSDDIMFTASDALFIVGLVPLTYQHRIPLEPFRFLTPIWLAGFGMLVGGLLLGSIACPVPSRWLIVGGQYLFAWVILPMILLRRGPECSAAMLKAFVWGAFAMNLFGAYIYFTYAGTFEEARAKFGLDFLSGGRRLGAFASDANWNGAVLAMAIPVVFYLWGKKLIGNFLALVWTAILMLGVMLTASFTAFISCAAAAAIFAAVGGIRPTPRTMLIAATIAGALLFGLATGWLPLPETFMSRVGNAIGNGDISEAGTYVGRVRLIEEAWGLVERHMVLGVGADQYRVISMYKAPVHNMYLLLWVEGGLLSLFGWLMMISVMVAAALFAYSRDRIASALSLSVITTFVIASTASPHMYARLWSVPVLLALSVSIEAVRDAGSAMRTRKAWARAKALV